MNRAKPFDIPKREVWEAFKRVKANQGAAGVDGQSIQDFEDQLTGNLYKLWNRLSSGSYVPVRPKHESFGLEEFAHWLYRRVFSSVSNPR